MVTHHVVTNVYSYNERHHLLQLIDPSSTDSSVGRAEDCSGIADILRSLVQIRLGGWKYFFYTQSLHITMATYHHGNACCD